MDDAVLAPGEVASMASPSRDGHDHRRTTEAVLLALRGAVSLIQARARSYDAAAIFPEEDIRLLRDIGAIEVFGHEAGGLDLMEALRLVGRSNLSVGRIFEGHVNGAALVRWYGDARQRRALERSLREGQVYGVWNTEPSPGVRIHSAAPGDPRLVGAKSYATGAGCIDRAIVTAALAGGGHAMVIADASDPARADPSAWRVRGMRATVSGTYDLSGLPADRSVVLGEPDDYGREPRFSAGAWRFTAVQLGGVERVLGLLRDHLVGGSKAASSVHRARFGEALTATRSAYLWVREAAMRTDSAHASLDVVPLVLLTRGVVERAGLQVMEAAARSVGTHAFFEDDPLDQACRDLAMYLRQPVPDEALDRAAAAFLERDRWGGDPLW